MPIRSSETYPGQRNKEKRALFAHFHFRVIQDVYRARFFKLFSERCFKCGRPEKPEPEIGKPPVLCIDHHIPMALGGRLATGNLVALCRDCNNRKLDRPPEAFYTADELSQLQPILDLQRDVFNFVLDGDRWMTDREQYLLEVGVPAKVVDAVLNDETHVHYVGHPTKDSTTTITIDISSIVSALKASAVLKSVDSEACNADESAQRRAADA